MFALLAGGSSIDYESREHIRLICFSLLPSPQTRPPRTYPLSETLRQKGVLFLRPSGRMVVNHFPIEPSFLGAAFGAGRLTGHGYDFMICFFLSFLFRVPVFFLDHLLHNITGKVRKLFVVVINCFRQVKIRLSSKHAHPGTWKKLAWWLFIVMVAKRFSMKVDSNLKMEKF